MDARNAALRGAVLAVAVLAASHAAARAQDAAGPARVVVPAVAELAPDAPVTVVPAGCANCGSPGGVTGYGPGIWGYGHKYAPPACDVHQS